MRHTIILCPFFNDEASLNLFLPALENLSLHNQQLSVLIVNDGSPGLKFHTNLSYRIIHLHRNIGHQRAIAIGLAYAHHHLTFDQIITMDCDGEDKPEDIWFRAPAKRPCRQQNRRGQKSKSAGRQKVPLFLQAVQVNFLCIDGEKNNIWEFHAAPQKGS